MTRTELTLTVGASAFDDTTISPEGPTFPGILITADRPLDEIHVRVRLWYDRFGRNDEHIWDERRELAGGHTVRYETAPLRRGGFLTAAANVRVKGDVKWAGWRELATVIITGTNPERPQVAAALNRPAWAACRAWSNGDGQFDDGLPVARASERGVRWGLMGVTCEDSEPMWSWRANALIGQARLDALIAAAIARPGGERAAGRQAPDFTEAQHLLEAWEQYGAGRPLWRLEGGAWVRPEGDTFADRCHLFYAQDPV